MAEVNDLNQKYKSLSKHQKGVVMKTYFNTVKAQNREKYTSPRVFEIHMRIVDKLPKSQWQIMCETIEEEHNHKKSLTK